jgi:hypothetical protein
VVVAVGVTVTEAPTPSEVPPHEPEYQFHVDAVPKAPPVIVRFEEEPGQTAAGAALAEVGTTDNVFRVTVVFTQRVVLQVP